MTTASNLKALLPCFAAVLHVLPSSRQARRLASSLTQNELAHSLPRVQCKRDCPRADHPPVAPNFMPFFFAIELAFQLPVVLYSVHRLGWAGSGSGTTGPFELVLLIYAFETAFSTMLCMNHVFYLDPADFTPAQRSAFLWQLMGPWVSVRKFCCCFSSSCLAYCTPRLDQWYFC